MCRIVFGVERNRHKKRTESIGDHQNHHLRIGDVQCVDIYTKPSKTDINTAINIDTQNNDKENERKQRADRFAGQTPEQS